MDRLKIVFMGTPDFSVSALVALYEKHEVICVYCQPPRKAGRGHKLRPSPVQAFAEEKGIEVRYPTSLKSEEEQAKFAALDADVAVVAAYGLILPKAILESPRLGCLNIHASLLPRWRGAAPIQRAIMAGDDETGICIMEMEEGLDTGAVFMQEEVVITENTTAGSLHDDLAKLGANLIVKAVESIVYSCIAPKEQSETGVTYAKKISKEEKLIDWSKTAKEVSCHIRGMSPFPGAVFEHDGNMIKVLECKIITEDTTRDTGVVADDFLSIVCGDGNAVQLTKLQRPGKAPAMVEDFLRGYSIPKGTCLA
ncbi:MAG: methionyl-tRNA formyltransferase [Alphaproteobacteria bacterium]|nr:methionyl-tRNA formyltransferase [Alphaproteobacteria bacterium]